MIDTNGGFPLPDPTCELTNTFWERAAQRQLAIPRCDRCGAYVWYPEPECPACAGELLTWVPMSGRGTLYSWVVVHHAFLPEFADKVPFVPALVALEEDPAVRVVTSMVDCAPEDLAVDMPVSVVFRPMTFAGVEGEVLAPFFRPVK
jgi:uncharacterized OB-fold protein